MTRSSLPFPDIGEDTFKDSPWFEFHAGNCYPFSPFDTAVVQADLGHAKELLARVFDRSPDGIQCGEHGTVNWSTYDDKGSKEFPAHVYQYSGHPNTVVVFDAACIGYYINGIWTLPGYELRRYTQKNTPTVSLLARLVHQIKLEQPGSMSAEIQKLMREYAKS